MLRIKTFFLNYNFLADVNFVPECVGQVAGLRLAPARRDADLLLVGVDVVDGETDGADVAVEDDGSLELEQGQVPVVAGLVVQRVVDDLGHAEQQVVRLGARVEVVVAQGHLQLELETNV